MTRTEELKKDAGIRAVDHLYSGMLVGLGTGSTSEFAIKELSKRVEKGQLTRISCVPSSKRTEKLAKTLGLKLVKLKSGQKIDINIDGADEIDPNFDLIKGGGGALLREKVLAQNSKKNIIIVDESKLSEYLGTKFALPIEVIEFALEVEKNYLESLGGKTRLRLAKDGSPFLTDQQNLIIDWDCGEITDPVGLAEKLSNRAGIVEHGLFIETADYVIISFSQEARLHPLSTIFGL